MKGARGLALALVMIVCLAARARGSAIPMWEFLTRAEKTSHLYRIFSQEVAEFCSESSMPDCSKNLLITGLKSLAHLGDDDLDEMDPYQRGAKDIIWRSIVGRRLGQHSFHAAEEDSLAVGENQLPQESTASRDFAHPSEQPGPYLSGPMVIRVYPDGRPVPKEEQRPLPKDEDIEDIRSNGRVPSIGELEEGPTINRSPLRAPATAILPPRKTSARSSNSYGSWLVLPGFRPRTARPNNLLVRERFY